MSNIVLESEAGIIAVALEVYANQLSAQYAAYGIASQPDKIAFETKVRDLATRFRNTDDKTILNKQQSNSDEKSLPHFPSITDDGYNYDAPLNT